MGKRAHTLSVIIISFNEEDRIRNCLESVKDVADEIIVVDSGSVDKTVEIAREYTDKVIVTDWPGYGPQKQRALDLATGDWVLSIDCDEVLDARMQQALHELMNQSRIAEVAFKLPWGLLYMESGWTGDVAREHRSGFFDAKVLASQWRRCMKLF